MCGPIPAQKQEANSALAQHDVHMCAFVSTFLGRNFQRGDVHMVVPNISCACIVSSRVLYPHSLTRFAKLTPNI